ncbi:hypothetical protein [Microvirga massiliensis]|uniref:hypothetical protein n=1 Tax=Microvirga massiliensis TaxID=1033741 RepID=UPI000ABE7F0D|nr:hypothetical protein [Microvirga massiliensis]
MTETGGNVVAFRKRGTRGPTRHPKVLIEAVYAAGSLPVAADDVGTKTAAVMLQALGFLVLEEVQADGTLRQLRGGEARRAFDRPWRLLRPGFDGAPGCPEAMGAFAPA